MKTYNLERIKLSNILDFSFYAACALFLGWLVFVLSSSQQLVRNLSLILVGFLSWTLIEYLLHRFILHGLQPFKRWHSEHHKHPNAVMYLPTLLSALMVLIMVFLPIFFMFGLVQACAVTLGVLAGYLVYTAVHHAIHHWQINSQWFAARKRFHHLHHHQDETHRFGVTNSFWDNVFAKLLHI